MGMRLGRSLVLSITDVSKHSRRNLAVSQMGTICCHLLVHSQGASLLLKAHTQLEHILPVGVHY